MRPEYIKELLQDNKTVIIPGIGAFVRTDTESQPVIFNEYLKFNDGLLAGYISKKENISIDEAGKKLEVFAGGINSVLESGRDVVMSGIGKLKTENGKISFSYDAAIKETEAPVIPKSEENKAPVTPLPKPENPKKEEIKKEIVPEKKVVAAEEKSKTKTDPKTAVPATEKKKKEKVIKEKKPGSKKRMVLFIILIILIGGGGTAGFIFRDKLNEIYVSLIGKSEEKKSDTPASDSTNTNATVQTTDTVAVHADSIPAETLTEETATVPEPEPEIAKPEKKAPVIQNTLSGGDYYVIVGCFTNEENVNEMIGRANAKGLQGSDVGVFGGLHHVAVYSSSDPSDAKRKAGEIRTDFPNAWVLKK